jgi:hypothetical protein
MPIKFGDLHIFFLLDVLILINPLSVVNGLRNVLVEGDIMLGGLFPIHEAGRNNSQCGAIKADQGLQRMTAMLVSFSWVPALLTLIICF